MSLTRTPPNPSWGDYPSGPFLRDSIPKGTAVTHPFGLLNYLLHSKGYRKGESPPQELAKAHAEGSPSSYRKWLGVLREPLIALCGHCHRKRPFYKEIRRAYWLWIEA